MKTDHPRACGANFDLATSADATAGSSPRVRGKPVDDEPHRGHARIIPARAGQTEAYVYVCIIHPDHPRACGANVVEVLTWDGTRGSSPRVRGKHLCANASEWRRRIIPARAGQTRSNLARCRVKTDHPRACGANSAGLAS